MKKIINGKMYNTDTAELVCDYWNGLSESDFCRIYKGLYRKKTGEFFIYAEGGAMTQYAVSYGNSRCGSETIYPISEEEAKEFTEKYANTDKYIEIFGEVEE